VGYAYNTPQMAVGWVRDDGTIHAQVERQSGGEG